MCSVTLRKQIENSIHLGCHWLACHTIYNHSNGYKYSKNMVIHLLIEIKTTLELLVIIKHGARFLIILMSVRHSTRIIHHNFDGNFNETRQQNDAANEHKSDLIQL